MRKAKLIFYLLILGGTISAFAFRGAILDYFSPKLNRVEKLAIDAAIQEIKTQVATPPPLRETAPAPENVAVPPRPLTESGTIKWTNIQRRADNLPPLAENAELDSAAAARLADMFQNQYFAHVSPSGESVETAAKDVGYDYLALGENLALGNFGSDEKLVEAWMASPGHRANILNPRYQEIGVAVRRGLYEGETRWIAVQVFGKPASSCPAPDAALKAEINGAENGLQDLQNSIDLLKSEINGTNPRNPGYNSLVAEYNSLVNEYNAALVQIKTEIADYNSQVSAFNQCASQ